MREFQHVLERAVILTQGICLALAWFQEARPDSPASPLGTLEEVERAHIVKTLEAAGWRLSGKDVRPSSSAHRTVRR